MAVAARLRTSITSAHEKISDLDPPLFLVSLEAMERLIPAAPPRAESCEALSEEWSEKVYASVDPMTLLASQMSSTIIGELAEGLEAVPQARALNAVEEEDSDKAVLHRPCAACRKARVKCDYCQPCSRCVRLNIAHECAPPPDVKRGRPKGSLGKPKSASPDGNKSGGERTGGSHGRASQLAGSAAAGSAAGAPRVCAPPPPPVLESGLDDEWPPLPSRGPSLASVAASLDAGALSASLAHCDVSMDVSYAASDPPLEGRAFRRGQRVGATARERTWEADDDEAEAGGRAFLPPRRREDDTDARRRSVVR